jgi:trimethylamine--corrinoid protein Co-methyltransferase
MARKKVLIRNLRPIGILTEEQIELIHKNTLDVLQKTGVRFESERALKLFKENGCEIDPEKNHVKFPPGLVEESLRMCPSSFQLKGRANQVLSFGGNTSCFLAFPGKDTIDLETWEPRTSGLRIFLRLCKCWKVMPQISEIALSHFIATMAMTVKYLLSTWQKL